MSFRDEWKRHRSEEAGGQRTIIGAALRWIGHYVQGFYARAGILLTTGLVLALFALWALSVLTEDVLEGDTARIDRAILLWLNEGATPFLDRAAVEITALGDTLVVVMVAVVAVSLLWLLGRRAYAGLLALSVSGGGIITPVLKAIFDRPRPQVFEWRAHYPESSAAYPSGHATMAVVTLAAMAFIIHRLADRRWVSVAALTVAGIAIFLIGLSRLYLGLHFPSDVLAGYGIGFAWVVFCAVLVETLQRRGMGSDARDDDPTPGEPHGRASLSGTTDPARR